MNIHHVVTRRHKLGLLTALVLAFATPPAHAQVPGLPNLPLPPGPNPGQPPAQPDPGKPPPPTGPGAGTGEVVSYRGNPAGTNNAADESVWGPIQRLWQRKFEGPTNQPLIAGGLVLVNVGKSNGTGYGSRIVALDPRTGKDVWQQDTPGVYFTAPIAANGGKVVSLNGDGDLRAFAIADGAPSWAAKVAGEHPFTRTPPVAAGGLVFTWYRAGSAFGYLQAFDVNTGALRWTKEVTVEADDFPPALDAERVFVAQGGGRIQAFYQSNGQSAWSHDGTGSGGRGVPVVVHDGRVYADGRIWDAATGAELGRYGAPQLDAIAGDSAYTSTSAYALDTGAARWTFRDPAKDAFDSTFMAPLVSGPTLFTVGRSNTVYGLDRASGKVLSSAKFDGEIGYVSVGGTQPGMASSGGLLVVAGGLTIAAFEPVLRPQETGADIAATEFDVLSGTEVGIVGGIRPDLRGKDAQLALETARAPRSAFAVSVRGNFDVDGTSYFSDRPTRNTQYRVAAAGVRSRPITIYAYPRVSSRVRRTSATRGQMRFTLKAGSDFRPGGRTIVAYIARVKAKKYVRLGSARVRGAGKGRAKASVPFKLLRKVGDKDYFAFCVKGLARAGWGRDDAFQRSCGHSRIKF